MKNSLEPLPVTGITAVTTGTVIWAILLVISLIARNSLNANGQGDWVWIAVAGTCLGLLGIRYTKRRAARITKAS